MSPLDHIASAVLARFGLSPRQFQLVFLGNHGGFSGARLWHVKADRPSYCLRAWPPGAMSPERLHFIHRLMAVARHSGLDFVPAVRVLPDGTTWIDKDGRLWELTTWQPGQANFRDHPTLPRLQAACTALARLHNAWSAGPAQRGTCPAVRRRLDGYQDWSALLSQGWYPVFSLPAADPIQPWAEHSWRLLPDLMDQLPTRLAAWADRQVVLQPCLCDIWHDHVLFDGDCVTGIVDYGSVKTDHVAVDLARLLGSLVLDDAKGRAAGLEAYARVRPLTSEELMLVELLDETGTLLGAANWLRWIYREGRRYEDRAAVAERLAVLVRRLTAWRTGRPCGLP